MQIKQSVDYKEALAPYKSAVSRYIRSAMILKHFRYDDLARALNDKGITLTDSNLRNKVSRGMFSADLLIAIIDVLDVGESAMGEILKQVDIEQSQ